MIEEKESGDPLIHRRLRLRAADVSPPLRHRITEVLLHAVVAALGFAVGAAIASGVTAAAGETVEVPDPVRQLEDREWVAPEAGTGRHR